jgi:hypothetical protein
MDHIEKGQFQDNTSSRAKNPEYLIGYDPWFLSMFKYSNAVNDINRILFKRQLMGISNDMEVLLGRGDIKVDRFHFL